eukprot:TRINITY_DN16142_c0_g2_i1.p1 TRINITY_DN16142_c0_g2~~TRINITY_DN16142_c0_g2_i1.p1  ORF type:complete len:253 (+),score=44.72 TRINITY_DN16142_c0_g2_i1:109-867(+)
MKSSRPKCSSIQLIGNYRMPQCPRSSRIAFRNLEQERLRHKTYRSQSPVESTKDLYHCRRSENKLQRHVQVSEQALKVVLAEALWNDMKKQLSTSHCNGSVSAANRRSTNFLFPIKKECKKIDDVVLTPKYSNKQKKLIKLAIATTDMLNKHRAREIIKSAKSISTQFDKENYKRAKAYSGYKKPPRKSLPKEVKGAHRDEMSLTITTVEENAICYPKISKVPKFITNNLSLIHICRCRRYAVCRSRWSPYH